MIEVRESLSFDCDPTLRSTDQRPPDRRTERYESRRSAYSERTQSFSKDFDDEGHRVN